MVPLYSPYENGNRVRKEGEGWWGGEDYWLARRITYCFGLGT
jgi:hypothetical protein